MVDSAIDMFFHETDPSRAGVRHPRRLNRPLHRQRMVRNIHRPAIAVKLALQRLRAEDKIEHLLHLLHTGIRNARIPLNHRLREIDLPIRNLTPELDARPCFFALANAFASAFIPTRLMSRLRIIRCYRQHQKDHTDYSRQQRTAPLTGTLSSISTLLSTISPLQLRPQRLDILYLMVFLPAAILPPPVPIIQTHPIPLSSYLSNSYHASSHDTLFVANASVFTSSFARYASPHITAPKNTTLF